MTQRRWWKSAISGRFVSRRYARNHRRTSIEQHTEPLPDLNALTPAEREHLRNVMRSEQSQRVDAKDRD